MIRRVDVEGLQTISVLGAGYTGLVTAACLARMGHTVRCVDRDEERIAELNRGVLPFREPGLDEAVATGLASGRLTFSHDPVALRGTSAVLVAVGTLDSSGEWTANQVEAALAAIVADPDAPRTIVIRSTVLPGTTARLDARARLIDPNVEIAFNPEFTREGTAVNDFFTPDRIVIGTTRDPAASGAVHLLRLIYGLLSAPLVVTDAESAELIKVGANVFLALKVGFANEMARLASAVDADVSTVMDGIGLDNRIGRAFLSPGPGFGGSCLPSQSRALPLVADSLGVQTPILAAVDASNRVQADWVVAQVKRQLGSLIGARVALLGLTFKAGTDDLRESRAMAIARALSRHGVTLTVHDPLAVAAGVEALATAGVTAAWSNDVVEALVGAEAVVVTTEWPAYRAIDWQAAREVMATDTVIDARQVVDIAAANAAGVKVVVHGRAAVPRQPGVEAGAT